MSKETIRKANDAKQFIKKAGDYTKEAKEIFKKIGDSEGERHASEIEKKIDEGYKYVEKRLGGAQEN